MEILKVIKFKKNYKRLLGFIVIWFLITFFSWWVGIFLILFYTLFVKKPYEILLFGLLMDSIKINQNSYYELFFPLTILCIGLIFFSKIIKPLIRTNEFFTE